MPRYDYRCEAGHKYELQQPFGSPTEHECQKCGKPARRIVTVAPSLVFKAGGYYKTAGRDFKADAASGSTSSSSGAASSGARSSGAGGEKPSSKSKARGASKPESKAGPKAKQPSKSRKGTAAPAAD